MSFSKFLTLSATGLLVWTGQAAPAFSNVTSNVPANATNFYKGGAQVLSIPLRRVEHQGVGTPSLARRYFNSEVLGVYGAAYFAELTMGTGDDPQSVSVLIDTGSFELWVNPDCSSTNVKDYCDAFGHYDPARSPSAKNLNKNFGIQYGQGSASGSYYTDDVYISGARVQDQQFGVSNTSSDVWFGILGLGRGKGGGVVEYSSVVDSLAAQGYTNSKLFSLDLGDQPGGTAAVTGEMVFGGVDTNKFSGNLAKVPTDPSDPHYVVTLNSLTLQTPDSAPASGSDNAVSLVASEPITDSNMPLPVVVDSGTTLSLLPESMVSALAAKFSGSKSDGNGGYTVPCSLRDEAAGGTLDFEFAGEGGAPVVINVAYSDFIWYGGNDQCFLGAWYTGDIGVWILGDTFLRGAYVAFDQSNDALYMANYIRCKEESNLVAVPAGPDAAADIPGSCKPPAVARPASPTKPSSDDPPPTPATTTVAVQKQASATPDEDCDDDDDVNIRKMHFETSTATETFTSTMIRHAVYTMDGQKVTTSHETIVATFCPGDIIPPSPAPPAPAPPHPHPHPQPETHAHTTTKPVAAATRVATITTEEHQVVATETCSTRIYAVTSCEPSAEDCTIGATTTEVITLFPTPHIHANPSPPSSPLQAHYDGPQISYSTYYTPSPYPQSQPPSPPQQNIANGMSAGVNYGGMSWGFNNSSSNLAGVAIAGGDASRGIGAIATPTRTREGVPMGPTASQTEFILPASSAVGRIGIRVEAVFLWSTVVVGVMTWVAFT
ncbi:acid protease [Hypoxylon trugodes]|uniref:acid protease n=1 Tax=Hypoxylon trugodes TaxID=326681 RepID=UPI002191B6C9|nr:acid protease [Hypoxylon trugodes]KAI1385408.1 acid protease [Hypoxylon trugodes]